MKENISELKPSFFKISWTIIFLTIFFMFFVYYKNISLSLLKFINIIDIIIFSIVFVLEIIRKQFFVNYKPFFKKALFLYLFLLFYTFGFKIFFRNFFLNSNNLKFYLTLYLLLKQIFTFLLFLYVNNFYSPFFKRINLKTPQVIVIGFFSVILLGSFLLYQPFSVTNDITYIDALFTSTSAVCVTGLIVKDTPKDFTFIGKLIILVLIQIGGLGIMVLYASIFILLPGKFSLTSYYFTSSALEVQSNKISFIGIIKIILLYTFFFELLGILLLYYRFTNIGFSKIRSIELSTFHSISAFCNAGFSLFSNSFVNYKSDIFLNLTIMFLIIFGGIGFTVGYEIFYYIKRKIIKKDLNTKLSVQSKAVILMYTILIFLGAFLFFISEKNNILQNLNLKTKILASFFQSITTRTAGFNTVDISKLKPSTYFFMDIFMFIGASSGSTGGGIKVTTFFVLIILFLSYIKERNSVVFKNKSFSDDTIKKAQSVFFSFLGFVVLWIYLLLLLENFPFEKIVFEVFSAFGTVGLSGGITPYLKPVSKFLIVIAMFTGRVGPLTLVSAMSKIVIDRTIKYPKANIMIG